MEWNYAGTVFHCARNRDNRNSGSSMAGVTELPTEIVDKIESVGMLESIPLWIVTLLSSLLIYRIVICDDPDSVWQNVQNLYVYGNCA